MVKSVAIVVICTNCYFLLGMRFIKKFNNFYKGTYKITYCVFTDTDPKLYLKGIDNFLYFETHHDSWISATNSKFSNILKLRKPHYSFDYVYYFDSDTNISNYFDDWFIGESVVGEHFSSNEMIATNTLSYERDSRSLAYIPENSPLKTMYFLGAFFGGAKRRIFQMCRILLNNLQKDINNNVHTCFQDESYINHYFHYNLPSKIVLYKDFPFITSCKGNLQNTRDINTSVDIQKRSILSRPDSLFEIENGKIVFK